MSLIKTHIHNKVTLPGEPASEASSQARAKLSSIISLWDADNWCCTPTREGQTLCAETQETLRDYDIDMDESLDAIRDQVLDAIMSMPLCRATLQGTWIDGEEVRATSFRIPLCLGGPSVFLCGEFGERGEPDMSTVHFVAAWWSPEEVVTLEGIDFAANAVDWALGYWLS